MNFSRDELTELCHAATEAATKASVYILSQLDQQHEKVHKDGGTSLASQVVTEVDQKAQALILDHLDASIKKYDLGLLTEEAPDDQSRAEKGYFWCIDPMDGTLAFTEGRTGYAVSIALVTRAGDPVVGVVYVPDVGQCYSSIKGHGVQLNKAPFVQSAVAASEVLHVYVDQSLTSETYFDTVAARLTDWFQQRTGGNVQWHTNFGAVRNAVGVMNAGSGCYFKFPKKTKGGGCIWDYAATRLFFEELELQVCNAKGDRLHLNDLTSSFMNEKGILYATDIELSTCIRALATTSQE